jgi:TRAP-type C4-dicarboxylate transport system permease small subunit
MSPLSKQQALKILKALAYSFASGFVGVLALVGLDFIHAAMNGQAAIVNLLTALLGAAVIGGINAVFVTIKQLLTPAEK